MKSLFKIICSALKSKIGPFWAKVRKAASPEFLKSLLMVRVKVYFQELLGIKPRDELDYYTFFSWMISRKLVMTLAILLGMVSLLLIFSFHPFRSFEGGGTVRAYRYDSLPLKFHKGKVKILAEDGYTAYIGEVAKGSASGRGTLFGKEGNLIYQGDFKDSMYNGTGTLYYKAGALRYEGGFRDNLYEGQGTGYWNNGSVEYTGNYENGMKSGEGELYNANGGPVFTGMFGGDEPVYAQLVGKTAGEAKDIYKGAATMYSSAGEFCVNMTELGAVYDAQDGTEALDEEWRISRVYVLREEFPLAGVTYRGVKSLTEVLGPPDYQGYSNVTLAEAVGIDALRRKVNYSLPDPELLIDQVFRDAVEVLEYNRGYDLYLYAFEHEGLVYSFYCTREEDRFFMYSVEYAR